MLLSALACMGAQAATITVNDASDGSVPSACTLRDAVAAINSGMDVNGCTGTGYGSNDTIEFDASLAGGTIGVASAGGGQINIATDLAINGLLDTHNNPAITLDANLGGSGSGNNRIFNVTGGSRLDIAGVRFVDGNGATAGSSFGGAISTHQLPSSSNHTLTLKHCAFEDNHASSAGGAVFSWSSVIINSSSFNNNTAPSAGGAVYTDTATINNGTFDGNSANGSNGDGGAIWVDSSASISSSTFDGNSARSSGGAINAMTAIIIDSTFKDNTVINDWGGAVSINTATISGSSFSGNKAPHGGAVNAYDTATISNSTFHSNEASNSSGGAVGATTAIINNSVFSSNVADTWGGAVDIGTATISSSTFYNNTAASDWGGAVAADDATISNSTFIGNEAINFGGGAVGAGILHARHLTLLNNTAGNSGEAVRVSPSGPSTLDNSIIIGNNGNGQCRNYSATPFTGTNNLEGYYDASNNWVTSTTTCGSTSPVAVTGTPALSGIIASTLANNGGPTPTLALPTGSPAVGAVDPTAFASGGTSQMWGFATNGWEDATLDQRGRSRAANPGERSVGAYEWKQPAPPPASLASIPTLPVSLLLALAASMALTGAATMRPRKR